MRSLGDSKLVKSSFIWLLIVPVTARLLSNMDEVVNLTIFESQINFTTGLPFSWQLLFGSACFFTIANIIYSALCPEILRGYKNYSEFKEHGKTLLQINSSMKSMTWSNKSRGVKKDYVMALASYFKNYCCGGIAKTESQLNESFSSFDNIEKANHAKVSNNAFYFTQNIADTYNRGAIICCLLSYGFGVLFISIIAVQNIIYVCKSFG
jgi:hypothetical protein